MKNARKITALALSCAAACLMTGASGAETAGEGAAPLDGIMIVSLPDAADGTLTYAGRALLEGEGVPAEHMDALAYEPLGSPDAEYSYLPVYADGSVGEVTAAGIRARSNVRPSAADCGVRTYRNLPVSGVFPVTDDGAEYTVQILSRPMLGQVTVEGGTFVYTPYQNRTGTDVFTYVVRDADGAWSGEAGVRVDIERQKSDVFYADLGASGAAYAAVRLAEEGIYTGRSIGGTCYFEPDEPVSRAEFTAMTMAALGLEASAPASTFFHDDEAIPAWTRAYVSAAVREGILGGESADGGAVLRADDGVTILEAAVILDRAALQEAGIEADAALPGTVPAWAEDAVLRTLGSGILPPDRLTGSRARESLTRGEAAQMLLRLLHVRETAAAQTGLFAWTTM